MNMHHLAVMATLALTGAASAQSAELSSAQRAVPAGSVAPVPGPAANFTGVVMVRPLAAPIAPGRTSLGEVTFPVGARSNWHTHPAGQTLYVTEGCGWTQQDGQPAVRICNRDTLVTPPGVRHWHGATATTGMTHLAITETVEGRNVDWMEPVSDAQFEAAGQTAK